MENPQYHFKGLDEITGAMIFFRCPEHKQERICVFPLPSRQQPWGASIVMVRKVQQNEGGGENHYELEKVSPHNKRKIGKLLTAPLAGGWKLTVRN